MPGADASIPTNAYENYSHINEKGGYKKQRISAKVQKTVEKPSIAIERFSKRNLDWLKRLSWGVLTIYCHLTS